MTHSQPNPARARRRTMLLVAGFLATAAVLFFAKSLFPALWPFGPREVRAKDSEGEATFAEVKQFCGHCHQYPPPETFPKHEWRKEVEQGYKFFYDSELSLPTPTLEKVVRYYQNHAPEKLTFEPYEPAQPNLPVQFACTNHRLPKQDVAAVSNVNLVRLTHKTKLDVLACDMREGWVTVFKPYAPEQSFAVGRLAHPAHAEVVDLDKDGSADVLVAELGVFLPNNAKAGRVVWFRGRADGGFTPVSLLDGVGRVADVQAADFNGDGKIDLVVAVFGWRQTGEVIYLENQTTDWNSPKFVPHVVDARHGAVHVPVADLNGDGKPDFVALISQDHETIVAFLNDGHGKFRKEVIFEGPHPSYGSSGIQLVDLNNDGKLDVLYTNGDVMDSGIKPWHSVQWLENRGQYPFVHHHLARLGGAHRAVAADVDGDGLLDVFAVACWPKDQIPPDIGDDRLDSIILLRQTASGKFTRYCVEKANCNHLTCAAGDLDGDGKIDLVTANFLLWSSSDATAPALSVWRNLGPG